jgi:hypothetical protein
MGRPAKWSRPTTAIRVPEHLAEHLLDIARQLDNPEPANNVQNPSGLPICKPKSDAATIAQGLAEGWIAHKLPDYPLQMLTSEGNGGTYRLFLGPPPELSPLMEHAIGEYCDQVLDELSERDQLLLVARLVEELGDKVDA